MDEKPRRPNLDDFTPKTRLQFPDGACLTVGTRQDEEAPLHFGVQLVYDSGKQPEPEMNILLPPHSIDVLIPVLEDLANQARFIMGQEPVDYPPRPQTGMPKRRRLPNRGRRANRNPAPDADHPS